MPMAAGALPVDSLTYIGLVVSITCYFAHCRDYLLCLSIVEDLHVGYLLLTKIGSTYRPVTIGPGDEEVEWVNLIS